MKIVIVGAGEVGCSIARRLSTEGHDVYLVEQDPDRADAAEEELDVTVVRGNGARPKVMDEVFGAAGTLDLLVACTNRDEANMVACWIARKRGVKRVIARARNLEFTDSTTWARELGIDQLISPERSVAREITGLLASSSTRTEDLLDGRAALYVFRVEQNSPCDGRSLEQIRLDPICTGAGTGEPLRFVVVYIEKAAAKNISAESEFDSEDPLATGAGALVPDGKAVLYAGDMCYVVMLKRDAQRLETLFAARPVDRNAQNDKDADPADSGLVPLDILNDQGKGVLSGALSDLVGGVSRKVRGAAQAKAAKVQAKPQGRLKRVFVIGGGKVGYQVARQIRREYGTLEIRIVDSDKARCDNLAADFGGVLVLNADGADREMLVREGIKNAGYVAATSNDEMNLIYASVAKSLGARRSIAVVRQGRYSSLIQTGLPVDAIVNTNEALASVILGEVRYPGTGRTLSIIENIDAEMLELVIPENFEPRKLTNLGLPRGEIVALRARAHSNSNDVEVPGGNTILAPGDKIILFAATSKMQDAIDFFNKPSKQETGNQTSDTIDLATVTGATGEVVGEVVIEERDGGVANVGVGL